MLVTSLFSVTRIAEESIWNDWPTVWSSHINARQKVDFLFTWILIERPSGRRRDQLRLYRHLSRQERERQRKTTSALWWFVYGGTTRGHFIWHNSTRIITDEWLRHGSTCLKATPVHAHWFCFRCDFIPRLRIRLIALRQWLFPSIACQSNQ